MAGPGVDKQISHDLTAACPTPFSVNRKTANNADMLAL
jgi:hypothetical protein